MVDDAEMSLEDEPLASSPDQGPSDGEPESLGDAANPSKRRAHSEAP